MSLTQNSRRIHVNTYSLPTMPLRPTSREKKTQQPFSQLLAQLCFDE
jgi:hypothetical protein